MSITSIMAPSRHVASAFADKLGGFRVWEWKRVRNCSRARVTMRGTWNIRCLLSSSSSSRKTGATHEYYFVRLSQRGRQTSAVCLFTGFLVSHWWYTFTRFPSLREMFHQCRCNVCDVIGYTCTARSYIVVGLLERFPTFPLSTTRANTTPSTLLYVFLTSRCVTLRLVLSFEHPCGLTRHIQNSIYPANLW